jgi:hypothetical protein
METIALTAGFGKPVRNGNGGNGHHRHHAREHMRGGRRCAVMRSITAAELYLAPGNAFDLAECALRCGTGVRYVRAAIALLKHGDAGLLNAVIHGQVGILVAAKPIKAEMRLVAAFQAAPPRARAAAGARIGVGLVWDGMVVPAISA